MKNRFQTGSAVSRDTHFSDIEWIMATGFGYGIKLQNPGRPANDLHQGYVSVSQLMQIIAVGW
jgi:hypothetical protein